MINKRKIMMTVGAITATVIPLAVVVSCSCSSQSKTTEKINKPTAPEPGVTSSSKEGGDKGVAEKEIPIVKISLEDAIGRIGNLPTIKANTFANVELPAGFEIPRVVTQIENGAFTNAILPDKFEIPKISILMDVPKVFGEAKLPKNSFWRRPTRAEHIVFESLDLQPGDIVRLVSDEFRSPYITQNEIDEIMYHPSRIIPQRAFADKILPPNFRIPFSIREIEYGAFKNAIFNGELILPNSLTSIQKNAFLNATFKQNVSVPSSVQNIGSGAFMFSKFEKDFQFQPTTNILPEEVFRATTLPQNFKLLPTFEGFGESAFSYANLYEGFKITFPVPLPSGLDLAIRDAKLPNGCGWFDANGRKTEVFDFSKEFLEVRKIENIQ